MNPIKVTGNWTEDYTLDKHSLYSIPIGENEFGRMRCLIPKGPNSENYFTK